MQSSNSLKRQRRRELFYGEKLLTTKRAMGTGGGEKQIKRQIANNNERRRMRSINDGFQTLKNLLPPHVDKDKMSKAGILQRSAEHMALLSKEYATLMMENAALKKSLGQCDSVQPPPPPPHLHSGTEHHRARLLPSGGRCRNRDTESSDEGIGLSPDDHSVSLIDELQRKVGELQEQLADERRHRQTLEQRLETPPTSCHCQDLTTSASSPVPAQLLVQVTEPCPPKSEDKPVSVARKNLETIVAAIEHLEGYDARCQQPGDDRAVPAAAMEAACAWCMRTGRDCHCQPPSLDNFSVSRVNDDAPLCLVRKRARSECERVDDHQRHIPGESSSSILYKLWQSPNLYLSPATDLSRSLPSSGNSFSSLNHHWLQLQSLASQGTC